jgi:SAM-dependent methyltransferase
VTVDRDDDERALLDEQIRYYRARAGEYDATSAPPGDPFAANAERIRAAIREFAPTGRVLELAAGTGLWTSLLAELAPELTAVDASPEMLRLNAQKVADPRVRYVVSDIFALRPDAAWDVVFFAAWLSHVPPGHFDAFWELVAGLLAPGGRVFIVDEAPHALWAEDWVHDAPGVVRRTLNDGVVHRAVKIVWRPDELEERLRGLGWDARLETSGPFYWGSASRAAP